MNLGFFHKTGLYRFYANKKKWSKIEEEYKIPDSLWLSKTFADNRFKQGQTLQLKNPTRYDDKIIYMMCRDKNPLKVRCSDKYLVRQYVKEKGLERILITPFFVYKNTREIDFEEFKEPMIIKNNHLSGNAIKYYPSHRVNRWDLRILDYNMKHDYYHSHREINYDGIKPVIIAEKLLMPTIGQTLYDYKFFCFDGEVLFCSVDSGVCDQKGNHAHEYYRNIVDRDFVEIAGVTETREHLNFALLSKPDNWNDMIRCAEILSKDFNHVRVDLYSVNGKTYFGELTFYHGAGLNNFQPLEFEQKLASKLDISKIQP